MITNDNNFDYQSLTSLKLFKGIDFPSIEHYLKQCEIRSLSKGEILLSPLEPNNYLCVLLDGSLSVHLDSPESEAIATIEVGESVGEMSLFEEEIPSAYVVGAADSKLICIHEEILWELIDCSDGLARNLLYLTSNRIREGNKKITASRKIQKQHEHHANIDPLTGAYNRRWIDNMFRREVRSCKTDDTPLSLVMIDIDHFKPYNDKHGHLAGDKCLQRVADVISNNLQPNEMLGRFGGEEFAVLLPGAMLSQGEKIAERMRAEVEKAEIRDDNLDILPSVTISLGVTELRPDDSLEKLFKVADMALYKAKENGRNCVCVQK